MKQRMDAARGQPQFRKWQALHLIQVLKLETGQVAQIVGTTPGMLSQWAFAYRRGGPQAFASKKIGGYLKTILTWEQEEELLGTLEEKARRGLVVMAKAVKEAAQELLGRDVSKDYAYDLLHRHGWRKVQPRPHHPKRNRSAQEEEKKTSAPMWKPPR